MNGTNPEKQIELLNPAIFSRYEEPEGSDGSEYELEILEQGPGLLTDRAAHRLAACTLNIVAPMGKHLSRMVDGKIDNLWLNDDETTANHIDILRVLSTLLGYVRTFCIDHKVPHLSSIQKTDHPVWLSDFFTAAGFNRCECLKPEAGGNCYRVCVKLDGSGVAIGQSHTQVSSARQIEQEDLPLEDRPSVVVSQTPIICADENPNQAVPDDTHDAHSMVDSQSPRAVLTKPSKKDQGLKSVPKSQKISSLPSQPKATEAPKIKIRVPRTMNLGEAVKNTDSPDENARKLAGDKRKRDEPTETHHTEGDTGGTQNRQSQAHKNDQPGSKEDQSPVLLQPKASPDEKHKQLPNLRYSSVLVPQPSKASLSKGRQETDDTGITDVLSALSSKPSLGKSLKPTKKEAPAAQPAPSSPRGRSAHYDPDIPARMLTCHFWAQGYCNKRDEDCGYAHHDTGQVARGPGGNKKLKHSGSNDVPTGPKVALYDSWRPT